MKAKDIMRSPVIAVKPSDTIGKVLEIMNKENVNGTPIVSDDNVLLGIIVKADIYRFLIEPGHYKSCPVEWVMEKKVVNGYIDEDAIDIAKRLREKDIIALPILDGDELVGIISIEDLLDCFLDDKCKRSEG